MEQVARIIFLTEKEKVTFFDGLLNRFLVWQVKVVVEPCVVLGVLHHAEFNLGLVVSFGIDNKFLDVHSVA
jgi:hypothetical protein